MFLTLVCVSPLSSGEDFFKKQEVIPHFLEGTIIQLFFVSKASFKVQLEEILILKMPSFILNKYDKSTVCYTN